MSSQVHNLVQGSDNWLKHRKSYYNASDASAMLGISPYKSRDDLLREKATGITREVNAATQRIFDEGHRLEAQALSCAVKKGDNFDGAEKIIGEDLFQPTMSRIFDDLSLSASFDGLTMLEDVVWEHKTLNASLRENFKNNIIPEQYKPQLEQQMLISGAESCLFMASNDEEEYHLWYESEPLLRKRLIAGWKQFAEDLKKWKPVEVFEALKVSDIEKLPALNVKISGGVTRSNMEAYKNTALKFIAAINTDLQTDQDFADADAMVKFCGKTEKELEAVKEAALSQTADIDELFKTIATLKAEMRAKRLELDKLVKSRKQSIKETIVMGARNTFGAHLAQLDTRLDNVVRMPDIETNFGIVIKNKRTIESLHNAVNTELARCKIAANELADKIDTNIKTMLEHAPEHRFLFTDLQQTCTKNADDFLAMVKLRVSDHKEKEYRKLEAERERIRKEEEAKAEAKERKAAAERERAAREEERAHMVKQNADRELRERTADVEHDSEQMVTTSKESTKKNTDMPLGECEPETADSLDDLEICDMNKQEENEIVKAFKAGFMQSGEGFNYEYGCDDKRLEQMALEYNA